MDRKRALRAAEAIQREMGDVLSRRMRDPRLAMMVTVTRVDVSEDLRYAKIFVSVLGSSTEKDLALKVLRQARRFIRGHLARCLDLRVAPEITFGLDESAENYLRIDGVLKQIHEEERDRSSDAPDGGSERGAA
ncbi:MAG: 30S ribosome-binding factor RbfA [Candidatus Eisenbacteria bacterium]|nr:30S ribosome-binding factor RbfA [Candidatus Eisenbacteria bacterium]